MEAASTESLVLYFYLQILNNLTRNAYIDGKPNLLLYSALTVPPFRSIKLRARSKACAACGDVGDGAMKEWSEIVEIIKDRMALDA